MGMDVFEVGGDDDEDEMEDDEGALRIEGEPVRENRTIFKQSIENGFAEKVLNVFALAASFKWAKITEWKSLEENFNHEDYELQTLMAAEGALKQIFANDNFKVNKRT